MELPPAAPPPNPYGVKRASVEHAGQRIGLPVGVEVRVGRDPSRAGLLVQDPRVSGLHASLRFDGNTTFVKDEHSTLGTHLDGRPAVPGIWTAVPAHGVVLLGPVPLQVSVE
jgi:pSer/pThr/pTyr-binding forkhead associated (FHA) protein